MSESRFEQLRSLFANNLPARLEALRAAMAEAARNPPDSPAVTDSMLLAHRLAGTAGTYGFRVAAHLGANCERALEDYQAHGEHLPEWEILVAKLPPGLGVSDDKALQHLEDSSPDTAAQGRLDLGDRR